MMLDPTTPFRGPHRIAQLVEAREDGLWRGTRPPGSDISDLPRVVQLAIIDEWTDDVVAAYREATKPEPPIEPGPTIEQRLAKLETDNVTTKTRLATIEADAGKTVLSLRD